MIGSHWWQNAALGDGLLVALDHVNQARSQPQRRPGWELAACSDYFRAWNQLATSLDSTLPPAPPHPDRPDHVGQRTESQIHRNVLDQLSVAEQFRLFNNPVVAAFPHFQPVILDHKSPGMSQRLADLTEPVIEAASRQHREFRDSWIRWEERGSGMAQTVSKLVRAVLVVRNNIQHGEKTTSGPDVQRRERNQDVGRVVLPLLSAIVDAVLDHPSERLIAYGTLRPGQPNEGIITVPGRWSGVTITGWIRDESGLPAYEADVSGQLIPAGLFRSDALPTIWSELDAFEGSNYERRLTMYGEDDGIGVANVYGWTGAAW